MGTSLPSRRPILVPTPRAGAGVVDTSLVPSSRGWMSNRWPSVSTKISPPEARTAPETTRNPLPNAPRDGTRTIFDDVRGRWIENRRAIAV